MGRVDRTDEFNGITVQHQQDRNTRNPDTPSSKPNSSELRNRFSAIVSTFVTSAAKGHLTVEQLQFYRDFMSVANGIIKSMNASPDKCNTAKLRTDISCLETSVMEDSSDNEDLFEHQKMIIMFLKQRLYQVERPSLMKHSKPKVTTSATASAVKECPERIITMTDEELVDTFDLSPAHLSALQQSTQHLLSQHTSFSHELDAVSTHLTSITHLQTLLSEQLEMQEALSERLLDEAEGTMGRVRKGNKLLEKVSTESGMRNLVVAVFLALSVLLIVFDWMN